MNLQQFTEEKIKELFNKNSYRFRSLGEQGMEEFIADIRQTIQDTARATADAVGGEIGIKWMQEGHNKNHKGYTKGCNEVLSSIVSKEKEWFIK